MCDAFEDGGTEDTLHVAHLETHSRDLALTDPECELLLRCVFSVRPQLFLPSLSLVSSNEPSVPQARTENRYCWPLRKHLVPLP